MSKADITHHYTSKNYHVDAMGGVDAKRILN